MLRFQLCDGGEHLANPRQAGAYLLGSDGVPIRAEIDRRNQELWCRKRAVGPAALAVLWPLEDGGRVLLDTTRLPEREKPYVLPVELLRGRLMRIAQKREDWGLYEFDGVEEINRNIEACRDEFVKSLQADTPEDASEVAQRGIGMGLLASEQLTALHAEIFFNRRKQVGGFPKRLLGCGIDVNEHDPRYVEQLAQAGDFASLPLSWRSVEPKEKSFNWDPYDKWVERLNKKRIPIRGTRLVSFDRADLPDWAFVWEHDYEAIRDLVYEHVRRVISRYGQHIQTWDVISGLHAHNTFNFNFEQLMELTRMTTAIAKQLAPRSSTVVDLVCPWGEYYATNQRTIPPMLYAEAVLQSGVSFDAFGVQFYFGAPQDGFFVRDLFQISCMLDRFANLGKPVHVTGVAAPSSTAVDQNAELCSDKEAASAGSWHKPWSPQIQRAWLRRVYHLALSKPFVESVTWRDLSDGSAHLVPHGGLLNADCSPKPAFEELLTLREEIRGGRRHVSHTPEK